MSETSPTGSADSTPKSRFRNRKTRKLTRRYQESLEDGEYSPLGTFSGFRTRQGVDTDDSAREESVERENDDVRNVGGEGDGDTRNDRVEDGESGSLGGEQQSFQDSGIAIVGGVLQRPAGLSGEEMASINDSAIEVPVQPATTQEVRVASVDSSTTRVSSQSLYTQEDKTLPEASALGVGAPARVFPFAATSRKRKRSTASTAADHEVDFVEYKEEPADLDFSKRVQDPYEAYVTKRQRKRINIYDHAHPSPYLHTPKTTPTVSPGRHGFYEIGQLIGDSSSSSSSYEKPKRPQPHSKDSGIVFSSGLDRSTAMQATPTPPLPSTTQQTIQGFEDDEFTNFSHADRLTLGSWDGTDGVEIILTDEAPSLQNCAINLLDLDLSWMDASQDVQMPSVDKDAIAPNGKTHNENIDEAWQTQLVAYHQHMRPLHVRGGNPAWEQWRREDDLAWELCCVRDEQTHQGHDPVPFLDPFEEILGYGGQDYAEDFFSLPITPVIRSFHFEDWSDDEGAFFGKEKQEVRLRGGALPEPHGEMGLDANDLAAVEGFITDNPREESVDVIDELPTNGEPSERPVEEVQESIRSKQREQPATKEPNGGPASKQHAPESATPNKSKQREQRIMESERELVDVSRHLALGEGGDEACWCVGMREFDNFGHY
ncbi:hypothetical protein N431DRAFT_472306 [Stipitochalara longipes BDJ]|nr:hypothetical protein N431DRAFT_472306 [Stipitochalara longipes BDJ]